jgi:hypothetical protein
MAKRKVNLLTFNRALSYGAVLQTYALVRVIESLGFDIEIIDFQAPFLPPRPTGLWTLKTYYSLSRIRKELIFRSFHRKYMANKTKAFYTYKSLLKYNFNADFYIVGSDQVWNIDITKKYAMLYFLDFVKGIKISYGASFGKSEWNCSEKLTEEIKNQLDCFTAISVREVDGLFILKECFGKSGRQVLDPTLLLNDYSELYSGGVADKGNILFYNVNCDSRFTETIEQIAEKAPLPVIIIGTLSSNMMIKSLPYATVPEFLNHFATASLVITDSYHGVIFSIINRKDFFVINNHSGRFTRIKNLLQKAGLSDRIVDYDKFPSENELLSSHIDYVRVYDKIDLLRTESIGFLRESLL